MPWEDFGTWDQKERVPVCSFFGTSAPASKFRLLSKLPLTRHPSWLLPQTGGSGAAGGQEGVPVGNGLRLHRTARQTDLTCLAAAGPQHPPPIKPLVTLQ